MIKAKDDKPILSILIATKNRIPYAISAINSILIIDDHRLELIVQDNSDVRELEDYIFANISDSRLRYRYTPPPFSSIDNFNAAIELATGEYVCLIGDDDGINPEIIEAALWAKDQELDALAVRQKVNYLWHNTGASSTLFTKVTGGVLTIQEIKGVIQYPNLESELSRLLQNGGVYYLDFLLPKLYHGLVRYECLLEIREKTGYFLGGLSPDIYSSLAIASIAKKIAVTDYPLTIPGACGASTSITEGTIKKHSKKLADAPHFRDRGPYPWCEYVPRVYAVECIWADSGLAALNDMGRKDLVQKFNLPKLAAFCIAGNKGVAGMVWRDLLKGVRIIGKQSVALAVFQFLLSFISGPFVKLMRRAWNRLLLLSGKRKVIHLENLNDMVETSQALTNYLKEQSFSFNTLVKRI